MGTKNDIDVKVSGQFYTETDGYLVPFQHVMSCEIEYKKFSQVSYGMSMYSQYLHIYSDNDGHFSFEINQIGANTIYLHSSFNDTDTLLYSNDTTLSFNDNTDLSDIKLIVRPIHTFNPILLPQVVHYDDSCIFTINHDYLTNIQLCYFRSQQDYDVIWETKVEYSPSVKFSIPDYFKKNSLQYFHIRYTTLHYGEWLSSIYRIK